MLSAMVIIKIYILFVNLHLKKGKNNDYPNCLIVSTISTTCSKKELTETRRDLAGGEEEKDLQLE